MSDIISIRLTEDDHGRKIISCHVRAANEYNFAFSTTSQNKLVDLEQAALVATALHRYDFVKMNRCGGDLSQDTDPRDYYRISQFVKKYKFSFLPGHDLYFG